jgi:hypothetical protein
VGHLNMFPHFNHDRSFHYHIRYNACEAYTKWAGIRARILVGAGCRGKRMRKYDLYIG